MGHTIATIFLPRSYCQTYSVYPRAGFCLQQDGAVAHRARDTVAFLQKRKVSDLISPTLWSQNSPDLNPVDYSIWSALQEIVCPSRITNVNELETRLMDEWPRFDQSIVDAAIGKWRCRVSACLRGVEHTLSTKHKVS